MDETKFADFKEDFSLLIESGFIAVKQLDEVSATRIFQAAQALSPANSAPKIGLGFIALNKLDLKQATEIFEAVNQQEPDNHLATTFLGMCYILSKNKINKGEKLIRESMAQTTDPTIKNLGVVALEWINKDINKKTKAPFFSKPQETGEEKE